MRTIHPFVEYRDVLELANVETAHDRRQAQTTKLFHEVSDQQERKLHRFLPKLKYKRNFNLRSAQKYHVGSVKLTDLRTVFSQQFCIILL